jgi:hypothetical protein
MDFQIAESMCDIGHYLPLAQAADEAGFAYFGLGDSVLYPERAVGSYPYNADGTREFLEGAPSSTPSSSSRRCPSSRRRSSSRSAC